MESVEIKFDEDSNDLFGMHSYSYHHNERWGYLAFILTCNDSGIYRPIEKYPVLGLLYAIGSKFRGESRNIIIPSGRVLDFSDLSCINFGYNGSESYHNVNEVSRLANEKRIRLSEGGILFLCGENSDNIDDRFR